MLPPAEPAPAKSPVESLEPLPYQRKLLELLKTREKALWDWFASAERLAERARSTRLELLKSAYRLEREMHGALYEVADRAAAALGLAVPLTVYQSQGGIGWNAALAYLPGEAHVLLTGPVASRLSSDELLSVFAHELSHFLLFERWGGEFQVVDRILNAMALHDRARPCHLQSARLFQLYGEIFADRGALLATGNRAACIAGLVKLETGIESVSAEGYLRQADEIFGHGDVKAGELTHPETFIRARALRLWTDQPGSVPEALERMIEGPLSLDELDLLGQARVAELTRRLLALHLRPRWFRSTAVLSHARLFFESFDAPPPGHADDTLVADLKAAGAALRDYWCYVLLDFAAVDPELEDAPLAAGFALCESLGWADRFEELAAKDLGTKKKHLARVKRDREKILSEAAAPASTPA